MLLANIKVGGGGKKKTSSNKETKKTATSGSTALQKNIAKRSGSNAKTTSGVRTAGVASKVVKPTTNKPTTKTAKPATSTTNKTAGKKTAKPITSAPATVQNNKTGVKVNAKPTTKPYVAPTVGGSAGSGNKGGSSGVSTGNKGGSSGGKTSGSTIAQTTSPVNNYRQDLEDYFRKQNENARLTALDAIEARMRAQQGEYDAQMAGLGDQYQALRNQSEVERYKTRNALREAQANRGQLDSGYGRQEQLLMDTQYGNAINSINMQEQKAREDIRNSILQLKAEGEADKTEINNQYAKALQDYIAQLKLSSQQ